MQKERVRGAPWHLTPSGAKRLANIKEKGSKFAELPRPKYENNGDTAVVIIAFDVPEKERRKRRWLRDALHSLGFQKVQQSVWIGKRRIPPEFMKDLKECAMLPYIQIFSVNRGGTLKQTY